MSHYSREDRARVYRAYCQAVAGAAKDPAKRREASTLLELLQVVTGTNDADEAIQRGRKATGKGRHHKPRAKGVNGREAGRNTVWLPPGVRPVEVLNNVGRGRRAR